MTLLHNIHRTLQRRRNSTWHALGYNTTVRAETPADHDAIAALTRKAFNGEQEVQLIERLRATCPSRIALVAEQHGSIVGYILFSAATLNSAPNTKLMALAPMAVSQVLQHQGIGSALVRAGLEQCYRQGIAAVAVLGHPAYYPRFGFEPASRYQITSPWPVPDAAYMVLPLHADELKQKSGTVCYHSAFDQLK